MHVEYIHVKHGNSHRGFAFVNDLVQNALMNISAIRKRRGLTQTDLAELTKLTQPTISRAERGEDSTTLATLTNIAQALDVPLSDLFSTDRSVVEAELLQLFRTLPPDSQKGWLDMARLASTDPQ